MLNVVIDTIFIVDVLVNFNTTFEMGYDVIYDRKMIAQHYLRTRFTIDIVSAIPIDLIMKIVT